MAVGEGTHTTPSNVRIVQFRSTLDEWITCYRRVMGTSRVLPRGETAVVEIMRDGEYHLMTADPSVYAQYPEIGWLGIDQAPVRAVLETWAGMVNTSD